MNYTENYHLPSWAKTDRIQMETFNDMTARLETALTANTAAHQTLTAQVAKCGNCKIWTSSYTGDGTHGAEHANQITFPAPPIVVWIFDKDSRLMCIGPYRGSCLNSVSGGTCNVDWNGNTVSWYLATGTAYSQMNGPNIKYYVVALLRAD